jgi:large conductance mechanosensitive channel
MFKDFKAFLLRGNVLDLAVAVVIGAAFGSIVKSMVDDVLMPPIGLLVGKVNFADRYWVLKAGTTPAPHDNLVEAHKAGAVTLNYGTFINAVIAFLIVAACVFMIVRIANRFAAKPVAAPPNTKPCPECTLAIPLAARRCPNCTSELDAVAAVGR